MSSGYNNWEQFYHKFNMIFHGIIAASLLPFAWVFLETQKEFPDPPLLEGVFALILKAGLVVLSAVAAAYAQVYRRQITRRVQLQEGLRERLSLYLREKLRQYAILGVAAITGLAGLYITKDQLFSFIYVAVLFAYSLGRPAYDATVRELGLSREEEKKLRAGDF